MYGRRDEAAVRQVVHGVEQDAALLRFRPDVRVDAAVVGRGDREEGALQVAAVVAAPPQLDRARRREVLEFPGEVGADHGDARPRLEQAHHLLLRHGAATHHDAAPSLEMQEYWIEAHGHLVIPSAWAACMHTLVLGVPTNTRAHFPLREAGPIRVALVTLLVLTS